MPIVCGIKFRGSGKVYYFAPGECDDLRIGDHVIVETARGREMGEVASESHEVSDAEIVGQLKPIVRKATTADLLDAQRYQHQEAEAVAKCKEQVARFGLPMNIVNAEYSYDGSRLTFYFTSEQRVDFRELVRELARILHVRIELRQIGVRDKAKSVGGIGRCGRPLCCATWLNEFCPVSIRMAKQQDLPLSPMEISGLCGRLLCCLGYENDFYQSVKGQFPKVGKTVSTPLGAAKVIGVSVLRETVELLFEDGSTAEWTADQLAGRAPIPVPETEELTEVQAGSLEEAIGDEAHGENGPRWSDAGQRVASGTDEAAQEQAGSAPTPAPSQPHRQRPRRSSGGRSAEPQGRAGAAPPQRVEEGQDRPEPSRRRPRRRRSRKPSGEQDKAAQS